MKKRKWGPTELARQADVHQPSVSALLNGHRGVDASTAKAIAAAINDEVSAGDLVLVEPAKRRRGGHAA